MPSSFSRFDDAPTRLSTVETRTARNAATILPASVVTSGGTASAQTMNAIVEAINFHHGHIANRPEAAAAGSGFAAFRYTSGKRGSV